MKIPLIKNMVNLQYIRQGYRNRSNFYGYFKQQKGVIFVNV
jgi:hypothetical protein